MKCQHKFLKNGVRVSFNDGKNKGSLTIISGKKSSLILNIDSKNRLVAGVSDSTEKVKYILQEISSFLPPVPGALKITGKLSSLSRSLYLINSFLRAYFFLGHLAAPLFYIQVYESESQLSEALVELHDDTLNLFYCTNLPLNKGKLYSPFLKLLKKEAIGLKKLFNI